MLDTLKYKPIFLTEAPPVKVKVKGGHPEEGFDEGDIDEPDDDTEAGSPPPEGPDEGDVPKVDPGGAEGDVPKPGAGGAEGDVPEADPGGAEGDVPKAGGAEGDVPEADPGGAEGDVPKPGGAEGDVPAAAPAAATPTDLPEDTEPQETEKKFVLFDNFKDLAGHAQRLGDGLAAAQTEIVVPEIRAAITILCEEIEDVRTKIKMIIASDFQKKDYKKLLVTYAFLRSAVETVSKVATGLMNSAKSKKDTT